MEWWKTGILFVADKKQFRADFIFFIYAVTIKYKDRSPSIKPNIPTLHCSNPPNGIQLLQYLSLLS